MTIKFLINRFERKFYHFAMTDNQKIVSIVDDENDITALFHDALQAIKDITVFTFTDPKLALEHFKKNKNAYALVLSDFRMSGLNGHELLKKIKNLKKQVRTVLLTAFEVEDAILADYMKKEIINAFIQKPVRLSVLIEVVNSELHNYEIQKRISSQR